MDHCENDSCCIIWLSIDRRCTFILDFPLHQQNVDAFQNDLGLEFLKRAIIITPSELMTASNANKIWCFTWFDL